MKAKLGTVFLCVIAFVSTYSLGANETNAASATLSPPQAMTSAEDKTKNETAIRELINGFVSAIRAKDINGVMSVFAPEVVSFDLGPPLQHGGGGAFVKRWQELFDIPESN